MRVFSVLLGKMSLHLTSAATAEHEVGSCCSGDWVVNKGYGQADIRRTFPGSYKILQVTDYPFVFMSLWELI